MRGVRAVSRVGGEPAPGSINGVCSAGWGTNRDNNVWKGT